MSEAFADLKTAEDALNEHLRDPEFRHEWQRTAPARAVSERLLMYRIEHKLSQSALARRLGMQQPAIARLEAGDHTPSVETLARLAQGLGICFHIEITPETVALTA